MELVLETAGESHGAVLTAILAGLPAGSPADPAHIAARLAARRQGRGRSARQRTERDVVRLTAGVRGDPGEDLEGARGRRDASDLHALGDPAAQDEARRRIDASAAAGDTLGGIVEVVATGVPAGLGGHERPEEKISARLGAALLGVQAVRAVEIGLGAAAAARRGSEVHDPILPAEGVILPGRGGAPPRRARNHAGGVEGGTTN